MLNAPVPGPTSTKAAPRICAIVAGGDRDEAVARTLCALAAQEGSGVEAVLCSKAAPAAADPLSLALGAVRDHGAAVVCWLRAGDEPTPGFIRRISEELDAGQSHGFASCWTAEPGSAAKGWRPDRLDGATLLAGAVTPPLALRAETVLGLAGGAPLERGLEEWDACLQLVERGVAGGLVRESLIVRARPPLALPAGESARHLASVGRVLEKHDAFCRSHLLEAVIHSESRLLDLVSANFALETAIASDLQPELGRRQLELRRLERRLAARRPGRPEGS